jgi:hypothetical protein
MKRWRMHTLGALVLVLAVVSTLTLATTTTSYAAAEATPSLGFLAPRPNFEATSSRIRFLAPNPNYESMTVDRSTTFLIGTLEGNAFSGDCVGFRGGSVTLLAPRASNEDTFVTWHQLAYTKFTSGADVWHATFSFLDSAGQVLFTTEQLHGARMTDVQHVYEWTVHSQVLKVDDFTYSRIHRVVWKNEC